MKKFHQIIIILSLLIFSCNQKNKDFVINGTLKNIPDSSKVYIFSDGKELYSSIVMNEKFKINSKVENPIKVNLIIFNSNDSKSFWLENSTITFIAEKGKFNEAQINGSETQNTETIINDKIDKVQNKIENLEKLSKDNKNLKEIDSIKTEYFKLINEKELISQDFVRKYPNSIISANILNMNVRKWSREIVSELFNEFSQQNKESIYGKEIDKFLVTTKQFPNFN